MAPRRVALLIAGSLLLIAGVVGSSVHAALQREERLQALQAAVALGNLGAAEEALRRGADPNGLPSGLRVWWKSWWNSSERRRLADPRFILGALKLDRNGNLRRYPPLFSASSPEMVRVLVRWGADPNQTGGWGNGTPLMAAAHGGRPHQVRALLEAGARVDLRDRAGFTALHSATSDLRWTVLPGAEGGHGQVIRILLEAGADVNVRLPDGTTPLQFAERSPHWKIVRQLRAAGGRR